MSKDAGVKVKLCSLSYSIVCAKLRAAVKLASELASQTLLRNRKSDSGFLEGLLCKSDAPDVTVFLEVVTVKARV